MAAPNGEDLVSPASPEDQLDHSNAVTFGIVNGVFIRKIPVTFVIYPEIANQIKEMVRVFEYVYELGVRRGVAIDEQVPEPIVQDPTLSTTKSSMTKL